MLTSFIIPTFDNYNLLADTVQSIKNTVDDNYEILIIDNGPKPRGYTIPANQGLRGANGDLLIVCNDDIIFADDWWIPIREEYSRGTWLFSPEEDPTMKIAGCCVCISREFYLETGGFDLRYRLWCGDVDLIKEAERRGRPPVRVSASKIAEHVTSHTCNREDIQDVITYWQQKDLVLYKDKWGTDPNVDKVINN